MKRDRQRLVNEMLYEKACKSVKEWFLSWNSGLEDTLHEDGIQDLMDRVKTRDELRAELYPDGGEQEKG